MAGREELMEMVQARIKGLSQQFIEENYEAAVDDAEEELGWSLPTTDKFRLKWLKLRARRHLISYLLIESANKFSVDQIKLNQKFENLFKLINKMDEDFQAAMEAYPELFEEVNSAVAFGIMIPAGFKSDWLGRDTTYKRFKG
jgi:hypothetical protein